MLSVLSRRGVRKGGASGETAWEGHGLQALLSQVGGVVPCPGPGPVLVLKGPSAPGGLRLSEGWVRVWQEDTISKRVSAMLRQGDT